MTGTTERLLNVAIQLIIYNTRMFTMLDPYGIRNFCDTARTFF